MSAILDGLIDKMTAHILGPDAPVSRPLKIVHEVKEFCDDPGPEEGADVLIALLVELRQRGYTNEDLLRATVRKILKNLERTWARKEDGTMQHTTGGVP